MAVAARILAKLNRRRETYRRLFSTPDGQYVLADLSRRNFALPNATTYVDGNPHRSTLNQGRQLAVAGIFGAINMDVTRLNAIAELLATQERDDHDE